MNQIDAPIERHPLATYHDLAGRMVFISGGATGIGRDMVLAFVEQQAKVVFVDIDSDSGKMLAEMTSSQAQFIECDVTDHNALSEAMDEAQKIGPLEVLINNAANDQRMTLADISADDWDRLVNVNLKHQFFASQHAATKMIPRGRGTIINFGSVAPEIMVPNLAIYSACKAGARGLTRSLARDLGQHGIRVNSILPGAVMTEKQRQLWYRDQASIDAMVSQQCIERVLCGEDIAQMALFLASDVSGACTAQDFIVDGGIL